MSLIQNFVLRDIPSAHTNSIKLMIEIFDNQLSEDQRAQIQREFITSFVLTNAED
jgi:hypothetical protein